MNKKMDLDALSYEQAFEELKTVIDQLEAGDKPLEETLALYERGQTLFRHCTTLLEQAEQDMKANRLTVPHGNNAFERYREVLTIEPRNQIAKKGLQDVVTRKMYIIQNAIQERDLKLAQKHIDQMMQLMPDNKKLKELRDLVAEARKR